MGGVLTNTVQEINQQVKRQRLEFSQQKAPLPHLSLSTIPPLGPMTTRAHSLPPLGTILRDQFSTPTVAQSIVAGRLKYFTHNWHKISESDWIRKTVAGYEIQLMYQPPVSHKPPKNWSSIQSQPASEELTKLLNKGVLVLADPCTPGFYSHIFSIPKKSGEQQLIINLKNLNRYISHVHFKMEGLVQLQDMLLSHDWMTKVDLKEAYYSVPIHPNSQDLLRIWWNNKPYKFVCIPFGLSSAPRTFTKLLKPLVAYLREKGTCLIIYIDDILLMADTEQKATFALLLSLDVFEFMGFLVNYKKSVLIPR